MTLRQTTSTRQIYFKGEKKSGVSIPQLLLSFLLDPTADRSMRRDTSVAIWHSIGEFLDREGCEILGGCGRILKRIESDELRSIQPS